MRIDHGLGMMLGFGLAGISAGAVVLPWRGAASLSQLYIRRIVGMMMLGGGLALCAFAIGLGTAP